ncbi:MAG: hypothetical protein KF878_36005 [Planctomycetes bacterium]|nr:hypothetical protein [Planctomycetota bacterium]
MGNERGGDERKGGERERPRVEPKGGATRCPFCHEACAPAEDVRVCRECLARHHAACWAEGAACGSCGAAEALAPEATASAAPASRAALVVGASLVVMVFGLQTFVLPAFEKMFKETGLDLPVATEWVLGGGLLGPTTVALLAVGLHLAGRFTGRRALAIGGIVGLGALVLTIALALALPLIQLVQRL